MAFTSKYKGKYVDPDPLSSGPVGVCDISRFVFNRKDLVRQMKWAGNNKVWTGLLVGKPFEDKLNEQNRPPMVKKDPYPVENARPPASNPPNALSSLEIEQILNNHNWGSN